MEHYVGMKTKSSLLNSCLLVYLWLDLPPFYKQHLESGKNIYFISWAEIVHLLRQNKISLNQFWYIFLSEPRLLACCCWVTVCPSSCLIYNIITQKVFFRLPIIQGSASMFALPALALVSSGDWGCDANAAASQLMNQSEGSLSNVPFHLTYRL